MSKWNILTCPSGPGSDATSIKGTALFLSLAFLAGCSGVPGESAASSSAALDPLSFMSLSVTPTDTTITIAYAVLGSALDVTLGGRTLAATLTSGATQNQSVTFTGLSPCQPYSWSIPSPNGTVAGQTNTRWTGNVACPASENITASESWEFKGGEHQEEQNFGCENWTSSWPVGDGWTFIPKDGSITSLEFGFSHFSNNSSFCAESTVEAWRSELFYTISPQQWARGVTNAKFSAIFATSGNYLIDANKPLCSPVVTELDKQTWALNSETGEWSGILGGPGIDLALAINPTGNPWVETVAVTDIAPGDYNTGGSMSFSFGAPQSTTLRAGFAAPNDGFAELEDGFTPSWAADNDDCATRLTNASVTLTYPPMPPETPICTVGINCTTATATCESTPEVFELFEGSTSGRLVGTFDATGGATPVLTDSSSAIDDTYYACTMNAAGATACAPVPEISGVGCPAPPPPPPLAATSIVVQTSPFWSGSTANAVVTLNEAAPAGGAWVMLTTSDPLNQGRATGVTVPWEATVPAGATSTTFAIAASTTALSSVVITGTLADVAYSTIVEIAAGPFLLTGGPGSLELFFQTPPAVGTVVSFTNSSPNIANVPATFVITSGATQQSVPVARNAYGWDSVTATYEGSSSTATVSFSPPPVNPPPKCVGLCQ